MSWMDPGENMFADVLYTIEGPGRLVTVHCIAGVVEQRHLFWQADVFGAVYNRAVATL